MRKINLIFLLIFWLYLLPLGFSQGVAINNLGANPDSSAILDVSSSTKGLLVTRLTTAQRDAIVTPAQSLLIYNTTTKCFEFWANSAWQTLGCACDVPAQPSAITGTSPVCQSQSGVTYSVTNVSGVIYTWSYSGTGFTIAGGQGTHAITANFSAAATSGTLTVTPLNSCGNGAAQTMNITVAAPPSTADAGTDISPACGISTATLAGNTPTVGTGTWSVVSGTATITTPSSPTSGVTGLTVPGTATLRWTISNTPCADAYDEVVITTTACGPSCGSQVWAIANLNAGTMINSSSSQASPYNYKYCYNNVAANCDIYGGLYQWNNVMLGASSINCDPCGSGGVQGMCPAGYHIPTDLEWSRYEWCVENTIAPTGTTPLVDFQTTGNDFRGSWTYGVGPADKMKVTSSDTPAWDGTNTSGFALLPAGICNTSHSFNYLEYMADLWSATITGSFAWGRSIETGISAISRYNYDKNVAMSVRCLKD